MSKKIEDKFQKFINTHQKLITTYEASESAIPLEYCAADIFRIYKAVLQKNKNIEFVEFLETGIKNSIKYNANIIDSLESYLSISNQDQTSNSIQQYFKEVNEIYNKNNNNYDIEYNGNNRKGLIHMNLKTVISVAKKYRGLGLSLNELISAGNLGLVTAYDKFDPSRSNLKDNILDAIKDLGSEIKYDELYEAIKPFLTYGDIKKKFVETFSKTNQTYTKKKLIRWINSNVYNAKFNSVAVMWIRAFILIEIDNYSRIVKKPKTEIYKDREKFGSYKKEITLDIDAPISSDSDTSISDILVIEDDSKSDLDVSEAYEVYKNGLNLLLDGVKKRDRNIFLKKFGIGLPRPMLPKEIADQEGLSIARISQIFRTVIEQMQKNQVKFNVDPDVLFDAVKKIN